MVLGICIGSSGRPQARASMAALKPDAQRLDVKCAESLLISPCSASTPIPAPFPGAAPCASADVFTSAAAAPSFTDRFHHPAAADPAAIAPVSSVAADPSLPQPEAIHGDPFPHFAARTDRPLYALVDRASISPLPARGHRSLARPFRKTRAAQLRAPSTPHCLHSQETHRWLTPTRP